MKELSAIEIASISGAGWLQDGMASLGAKIGNAVWTTSSSLLSVEVPLIGTLNLATIAPTLGQNIGQNFGYTIGGTIESRLTALPVVGDLIKKWLNN